jgi:hypothetical protein
MSSYNQPNDEPVVKTAPSTGNALNVFPNPTTSRVGYSIHNKSGALVYVQELPENFDAPTAAEVVAAPSDTIPAGQTLVRGARAMTQVFIAVASATADTFAQELE